MKELKIPPDELFGVSDDVRFSINDIPTRITSMSDERGNFFAIEATSPELADICGDIVLGKLITEIDYLTYQGQLAVIKAYF